MFPVDPYDISTPTFLVRSVRFLEIFPEISTQHIHNTKPMSVTHTHTLFAGTTTCSTGTPGHPHNTRSEIAPMPTPDCSNRQNKKRCCNAGTTLEPKEAVRTTPNRKSHARRIRPRGVMRHEVRDSNQHAQRHIFLTGNPSCRLRFPGKFLEIQSG